MTTEKMTVHEALCELKTLDARITKSISESTFVFSNKHSNTKVRGVAIDKYCDEIKSKYQAICDLIARRNAIKRAVTMSNATTKITVNGEEFTVAEAIDMKNHGIPLMERQLIKLDSDNKKARSEADKNNGDLLEMRADEYVKSLYGNVDMKGASDEIKKVRADFIAAQTTEVVDPINAVAKMEELTKYIDGFSVKIDSALSVSNALTEIAVEY